ncbi:MAG: thiamine diphosphokinase [Ruminococcaceae bacterium]|nr:thiamine diphosphokinase [Oscillospiraceae bacterium]
MKKRCVIVSAGDFSPADYQPHRDDYVIAADGGYEYLKQMGQTPDLCIGDFDSLGYAPSDCPVCTLPVEKDCTDTDAAVRKGLEAGCTEFLLLGMLGGSRLSHTLANLQTLSVMAEKHLSHRLVCDGITVRALAKGDAAHFSEKDNCHVSVLAITDTAAVTLRGLYYNGECLSLSNRFPLGVSNSTVGKNALVRCEDGVLLVVTETK